MGPSEEIKIRDEHIKVLESEINRLKEEDDKNAIAFADYIIFSHCSNRSEVRFYYNKFLESQNKH